jgi:hypothetical protein
MTKHGLSAGRKSGLPDLRSMMRNSGQARVPSGRFKGGGREWNG